MKSKIAKLTERGGKLSPISVLDLGIGAHKSLGVVLPYVLRLFLCVSTCR